MRDGPRRSPRRPRFRIRALRARCRVRPRRYTHPSPRRHRPRRWRRRRPAVRPPPPARPRNGRRRGVREISVPTKPAPVLLSPNGCHTAPARLTTTPSPLASGFCASRQRVAQIRGTVGVRGVGAAHGPGENDRRGTVVGEVQPERGFLHRVGAVSDDHAVGARVGRSHRGGADAVPVRGDQLRTVDRHQVDDVEIDAGSRRPISGPHRPALGARRRRRFCSSQWCLRW